MASVKSWVFLLLLAILCTVNASKLVYRKYEKKHPKKNYVQVVEIFQTRQAPPRYSANEKDLNDFLARDSYKTDMNCSKANESESETFKPPISRPTLLSTRPVTTTLRPVTRPITTFPTIPTTAFRQVTSPTTPRYTSAPNLNNLFTIRMTKPTIRPNPRENKNPDYTNLLPETKPNVQMTKHPLTTMPPTIVIKETDDYPATNRTTLVDIEKEIYTRKSVSVPTTVSTTTEFLDEEIVYPDSGEEPFDEGDENYNENNYPDVIPTDQIEPTGPSETYSDKEDYDEDEDGEDYDELGKRRKRRKIKRVAPLPANT